MLRDAAKDNEKIHPVQIAHICTIYPYILSRMVQNQQRQSDAFRGFHSLVLVVVELCYERPVLSTVSLVGVSCSFVLLFYLFLRIFPECVWSVFFVPLPFDFLNIDVIQSALSL